MITDIVKILSYSKKNNQMEIIKQMTSIDVGLCMLANFLDLGSLTSTNEWDLVILPNGGSFIKCSPSTGRQELHSDDMVYINPNREPISCPVYFCMVADSCGLNLWIVVRSHLYTQISDPVRTFFPIM